MPDLNANFAIINCKEMEHEIHRAEKPLFGSSKFLFISLGVLCLTPLISPPIALLMGIILAQLATNPFKKSVTRMTHILLQVSVVGLGFGMDVHGAMQAGKEGIFFTIVSITGTLLLGLLFRKLLHIDKVTSFLISAGTAICGGSAIAALSPVLKAGEKQMSVALGTVFILNSIALFIFPIIGRSLHLSQNDFGLWCAIAIHDTSSVVGAAARYGNRALEVATTVKLARALWIIPVTLLSSVVFKNKEARIKIPYFIGLFILAILVNTYIPVVRNISLYIVNISKAGLTLTLFLIGTGLSGGLIKSVGIRPILQGIFLWVIISVFALAVIMKI